MKFNRSVVTLLIAGFSLVGCAHTAEKAVDAKVANEPTLTRADLQDAAQKSIDNSTTLTAEQKKRLSDLRVSTRQQLGELAQKSVKLRAILIQDVLAQDERTQEVKQIKKQIRDTENKRLALIFDAVDEANRILGREAAKHAPLFDEYLGSGEGRRLE